MKDILVKLFGINRKLKDDSYAKFPTKTVYDREVSKFAFEHMKLIDCLDFRKVTSAVLLSFTLMSKEDFNENDYEGLKFDL